MVACDLIMLGTLPLSAWHGHSIQLFIVVDSRSKTFGTQINFQFWAINVPSELIKLNYSVINLFSIVAWSVAGPRT